jgi:hypothetical protein
MALCPLTRASDCLGQEPEKSDIDSSLNFSGENIEWLLVIPRIADIAYTNYGGLALRFIFWSWKD